MEPKTKVDIFKAGPAMDSEYFGMDLGREPSKTAMQSVDYVSVEPKLKVSILKPRPTDKQDNRCVYSPDYGFLEEPTPEPQYVMVRPTVEPTTRYRREQDWDSLDTDRMTSSEIVSILNDVANGHPERLNILRQTANVAYNSIYDSWRNQAQIDAAMQTMPAVTVSATDASDALLYLMAQMPKTEPEAKATVKVLKRRIVIRKREDV